ncbi:purine/pyrimidine permease [Ectobacillus antri]|jgi:xanthine/uracil permease|uniref:Purine/pyrimidine permease n=1 Tax=Ectobacillus antri TaxID=2486280 RepID=A0ABT6H5U2_9BACI|nr:MULTISPECIES: purine/pyrimidine permease [Ectobacillus]MDG4657690.1 purine/pyrimidine permease [Ectobacillus antri]MDG5754697.1 purine/pyrimidine permease [Ectobacillus antri]UOY91287.1 purine/pyrimidine permease [Ectobacillus sp. JY-23]
MKLILVALQWAFFILAGSLVVPISIAAGYDLEGAEALAFVQRTLFVLGIAGILQAWLGHRLPIQEGPAGLWWGVMSLYAGLGIVLFGSQTETLRVMQYAFMLSGILCILLSVFGLIDKLVRFFTPTVIGTYLFLLVAQLSGSFLKGMAGLGQNHDTVQGGILALSLCIILASLLFKKIPVIGQYSVLFSMLLGWGLFAWFGFAEPLPSITQIISLPRIFVFGLPRMETNMIVTVVFVTLLLLTNMLASIRVVQQVLAGQDVSFAENRFKQAGIFSGVGQLLGGLFSAIGPVAISGSAGFISSSKINTRLPFILGSALIVIMSVFPGVTALFAGIPPAVGYAALFPVFSGMLGLAFKEFESVTDKERMFRIVGFSLFTGIGVMFIPPQAYTSLPPFLASFLSNGLVLGAVMAIVLDAWQPRK